MQNLCSVFHLFGEESQRHSAYILSFQGEVGKSYILLRSSTNETGSQQRRQVTDKSSKAHHTKIKINQTETSGHTSSAPSKPLTTIYTLKSY